MARSNAKRRRRTRAPDKLKGHFRLKIPPGTRVVGFGAWAKEQDDVDFRLPNKDPRRRPPERPEPGDPEEAC